MSKTFFELREELNTFNEDVKYHNKMATAHDHHADAHESEATNSMDDDDHDHSGDHDMASVDHVQAQKAHTAAAAAHKQYGAGSQQYKSAAAKAKKATSIAKSSSSHIDFHHVSKPKLSLESVSEGPFKGIGKMMMKRKLDKNIKKADADAGAHLSKWINAPSTNLHYDAKKKADKMSARLSKAKDRLNRPKSSDNNYGFKQR